MIETKYLIMIGSIICLLILYYFYDEITNIKKMFIPAYQKTMALEAKLIDLEKRNPSQKLLKSNNRPADTPILSLSYQSPAAKTNENASVRCIDLSDTEAKELIATINKTKNSLNSKSGQHGVTGSNTNPGVSSIDIINNNISSLIKNNNANIINGAKSNNSKNNTSGNIKNNASNNIKNNTSNNIKNKSNKPKVVDNSMNSASVSNIFNDLSENTCNSLKASDLYNLTINDIELNADVIRSISESVQLADLPLESVQPYSEIPMKDLNKMRKTKNSKQSQKPVDSQTKNKSNK
jgi:hypothetical protein